MDSRKKESLRGLSLHDLKQHTTTSSPPAAFVQSQRDPEFVNRFTSLVLEDRDQCPPSQNNRHILDKTPPNYDFTFSFQNPISHNSSPSLLAFGTQILEDSAFTISYPRMVREQEPARNPLAPAVANSQSIPRAMDTQNSQTWSSPKVMKSVLDEQDISSPQPVFGRPTQLGAAPQPFARYQPLQRPESIEQQSKVEGRVPSGTNHLFISNKSGNRRPEYHKPHMTSNPLQSLHRPPGGGNPLSQVNATSQKSQTEQSRSVNNIRPRPTRVIDSSDDDDVFEIPKPTNFPTWQPKPVTHTTFSSSHSTNPYFQTKPSTTTFMSKTTLAANTVADGGIWEDRYNAADPSIYLDSGKANEELKALFEGSLEDEDDKRKTAEKGKHLKAKVGELAEDMNSLTVKSGEQYPAENNEEAEDDSTVEGLKVKLLPHQIQGVKWMRTKERGRENGVGMTKGGILADDMGLGKTIQSIALMLTNSPPELAEQVPGSESKYDKCTLIVAPLALIKQWEGELKDRVTSTHAFKVCVHHGPNRAKSYKDLRKYDIVITTYQTLSSEHAACSDKIRAGCFGINWYRIILDEAHSIKNRNAKVTKAACALEAKYRWCLSGTPMQNNLDELQSLIHFLQIGPLDKYEYWKSRIIQPINSGRGGLAIRRLQTALKPMMKRRTKDILKQDGALQNHEKGSKEQTGDPGFKIVKRTVEKVEAEFTAEERSFYSSLESRIDRNLERMMAGDKKVSYASALVLLLRLRQACNHAKLLGFDLAGERDALGDGTQTPRKKAGNDVDDLTAMLGGLNVEMKQCDICQGDLSNEEVENGALRCRECEEDLHGQVNIWKPKQQKKKETKAIIKNDRKIKRRVIVDSDDDEDEEESKAKLVSKTVNLANSDTETDSEDDDEDDQTSSEDDDYDSDDSLSPKKLVASTKIRHLISILRADSHTHKYIVFSFFTSMLNLIEPFLRQHHIKFTRYDGSMRNDAREAALHSLRNDPTTRVLLCSLRAGSLGLNLTAASRVVVLEPFWNPFVEEQAIDRVHRLNQTQDVVVYKLTIKDTVEARILELQEKKRELARLTVEGGGVGKGGVAKLTLAEMMKLFEHATEGDAFVDMIGMKEGRGLLDRDGDSTADPAEEAERKFFGKDFKDKGKEKRREHEIYGRRW